MELLYYYCVTKKVFKISHEIFQRFLTSKSTEQGTGLALSFSDDIVKVDVGELMKETMESEGSTFYSQTIKINKQDSYLLFHSTTH